MLQAQPLIPQGADIRVQLLQFGIAAAYAVAMFGVDWMFQRAWVRAFATLWGIWWLAFLLGIPIAGQSFFAAGELLIGVLIGPLPLLKWTVDEMSGISSGPRPRAWPLILRSLLWASACWALVSVTASIAPNGVAVATLLRRILLACSLFAVAFIVARGRQRSRASRAPGLLIAWGFVLFGARVLIVAAAVWIDPQAVSATGAFWIMAMQLVQTTVSGLLTLFATLIGERRALKKQQARAIAAERTAAHADRLDSLGRMAGGVAHDFNNVLAAIEACAELASDSAHAPDIVKSELTELRNASQRGRQLTRQLLSYSRRDAVDEVDFDPSTRLQSVVEMLRRLMGSSVALKLTLIGNEVGRVHMDASQFEQITMNLTLNARDAMPNGGIVELSLHSEMRDELFDVTTGPLPAKRYVVLTSRDEGVGIPAESIANIFDPFYSTKGPDHGTGLGLATVQAIVLRAHGGIDVESAPNQGSTFRVFLPAA